MTRKKRGTWIRHLHDSQLRELWQNKDALIEEIASRMGFSYFTVFARARRLGLPKRQSGRRRDRGKSPNVERDNIIREEHKAGAGLDMLANKYNLTHRRIKDITKSN